MNLSKKLLEGLGRFAELEDADGSGYMDSQEALAVQRFRQEVAADFEGIAAELLHLESSPLRAKVLLRKLFEQVGQATATGAFTSDEFALVERYQSEIDHVVDRLASKADWQLGFYRAYHRTPEFIRNWIIVLLLASVTLSIAFLISS